MSRIDPFLQRTTIAYFTMEIALRPEIHTYSGGLGVLAGDTARSCADLELPVVFVSLASRGGFLRQEIDAAGRQVDHPDPWEPKDWATSLPAMVGLEIDARTVWIRPWLYVLSCPLDHRIPIILLDTDVEENEPSDREITHRLYGGDAVYRLKQEIVLGIGGERVLHALGFDIRTYHLNEGHAALLTLALLRRHRRPPEYATDPLRYDIDPVRERCVFTTHTPVAAGHDRFPYALVSRLLGDYIEIEQIKLLVGADELNMTALALHLTGYVNGVARRHAETAGRMFPGYAVRAITNGVHVPTWAHGSFARLFQKHFPQWGHEPDVLSSGDQISDDEIWSAHQEAKAGLIRTARELTGVELDLDTPIIGLARRMTAYKRPELLFADVELLLRIARSQPFQVVLAGKAHPQDGSGKQLIEEIHGYIRTVVGAVPMAFLPNYDMSLAQTVVAGSDVWLNTPLPPLEASGTSGMKAAINGVLNFSVLDGWWLEACIDGVTGWAIGDDGGPRSHAAAFYDKLEATVLPLYYRNRPRWIWMMKQSISKIGAHFNSQRMMRRYASEAYLR